MYIIINHYICITIIQIIGLLICLIKNGNILLETTNHAKFKNDLSVIVVKLYMIEALCILLMTLHITFVMIVEINSYLERCKVGCCIFSDFEKNKSKH